MNWQETLDRAKDLVKEGNARKVTVRKGDGSTVAEIPLTFGVAGTLLAPTVAVLGAGAALVTGCSISLDRPEDEPSDPAVTDMVDPAPATDTDPADPLA